MSFPSLLFLLPALVQSGASQTDKPVISFPKPHHDFGKIPPDRKVTHRFKVVNTGKAYLNITHLNPSCGCTATVLEKWSLAPGEETFIEAAFNPAGMRGVVRKSIQVISNDPVTRASTVTFEAEVVSEIMPSTTALFFTDVPRSAPRKAELRLVSGNGQPVTITQIKAPGAPYLTATWKNEGNDAMVQVLFEPAKVPARQRSGNDAITIGTTNSRMPTIVVNASWEIRPVIVAEPPRVSFVDAAGKALKGRLMLKHVDGKPFTVKGAECRNSLVTVEGLGKRAAQQELQVALSAASRRGVINERLILRTDDPDQPELEVFVSAVLQ